MATEQQKTNVSNTYFDLVSVLYHSLEASQTYASYIKDAQNSGNQQLVQLFQQMQQQHDQWAQRAQQLLSQFGSGSQGS